MKKTHGQDSAVVEGGRRIWGLPVRSAIAVVALAAAYAAVDVVVSMTLPLILWPDIDIWIWLVPHWAWHPLEAARHVVEGKFLWLYEPAAPENPTGYYYMPLGPVLFAPVVALGDALQLTDYRVGLGSRPGLLPLMIGYGAFTGAVAVAAGAWRLAGLRGAVTALVAAKALLLGWAQLDLLMAGFLLLAVAASSDSGRGRWTGLALLTKQTAGPMVLPLVVANLRARRFMGWAVAVPAAVILSMLVAAPAATLNAVSAARSATMDQRLCDEVGACMFGSVMSGGLIPSTWSSATSLRLAWGAWIIAAVLLSLRLRHRIAVDPRLVLAVITLIAVLRPLLQQVASGPEPHYWATPAVCAAILAEMNRRERLLAISSPQQDDRRQVLSGTRRRRLSAVIRGGGGGIGIVTASVVLRYWLNDYVVLSTVEWPWFLDPWGKPWSERGPETAQALMFLAVAVPCAAVFAWPAISVLSPRTRHRLTDIPDSPPPKPLEASRTPRCQQAANPPANERATPLR